MDELLRFNFNQKYLVIDCETEGLNLINSRPWQVSWFTAKGKFIEKKNDRFLEWPNLKVSEGAARITGFDINKHKRVQEDPSKVLNDLWPIISNPEYIIIGQNLLGFDVYVLNTLRKKCGLESDYSYIPRVIDTRSLAMAIGTGHKELARGDIFSQYRFLNHRDKKIKASQGALLKQYNIDHDPSRLHDGLYDIEMTFKIFWQQIQEIAI
jgi:DNA polymerase III epsilon subunit-like protein